MNVKKIVSLLSVVFLLFALAAPVFAAMPELSLTSVSCKKDETVEVILRVNNSAGLTSGTLFVNFDSKYLKFISAEESEDVSGEGLLLECGLTRDRNVVGCAFMDFGDSGVKRKEMDIMRIKFQAKKTGVSELTLDIESLEINGISIEDKLSPVSADVNISKSEEADGKLRNVFFIGGIVVVAVIGASVIHSLIKKQKNKK